jgi:Regulator of ribonuclease activity B
MNIVEHLLWAAERDAELLEQIRERGDDSSLPRDIDFCIAVSERKKAETVCSFINDNQYGDAHVEENEGSFRVIMVVHLPLYTSAIKALSATMVSLSHIFSVDFVGWGCAIEGKDEGAEPMGAV